MNPAASARARHRQLRILAMLLCGASATVLTGLLGQWIYAPAVGWTVAALVYNAWVWLKIAPMDASQTAAHAQEEDPGQRLSDLLILLAALGSLAAVVLVMVGSKDVAGTGRLLLALLAMTCTAMSWLIGSTRSSRCATRRFTTRANPAASDSIRTSRRSTPTLPTWRLALA
ncbi:DUF1345 domain-containing protein [Arthrobacter psychrolactophilus]